MDKKPCKEVALGILSRRDYGLKELAKRLRDKAYSLKEVAEAVLDLQKQGYLNDARFAENRARHRAVNSRWGSAKIRAELLNLGIDGEHVRQAINKLQAEGVMFDVTATELVARKFGPHDQAEGYLKEMSAAEARNARRAARDKRIAFLLRRGYTLDEAKSAVDKASQSEE